MVIRGEEKAERGPEAGRSASLRAAFDAARKAYFGPIVGGWARKRVLVLGPGAGPLAKVLADAGAEAVPHIPAALDPAAARRDLLPFSEASFDLVYCAALTAQPVPPEQLLAEASRVLKHRGKLLYDGVNRTRLARLLLVQVLRRAQHGPARFLTPDETAEMLRAVGLAPRGLTGLGPHRLSMRGAPVLGPVAALSVVYAGWAWADKPGIY